MQSSHESFDVDVVDHCHCCCHHHDDEALVVDTADDDGVIDR